MSRIAKPGQLTAIKEAGKRPRHLWLRRGTHAAPVRFSGYLSRQPKLGLLLFGIFLVGAVGLIDFFAGPMFSFLPFYLLPVALTTWYVGRRAGLALTLAGVSLWALNYIAARPVGWDSLAAYWNIGMQVIIFTVVAVTLSKMRQALNNERELARTDPVTGVANWRAFYERVEQTIFYARRYKTPFTGVYMDVDNFKAVNDHFGHSTGDFCLRVVADTLLENTRATDLVARIAGDEFAVLMPETSPEQARAVIGRLGENLLAAMERNGWPATFSIGVATYLAPPDTADSLIKASDDLMYSVKNGGKNGIRYAVYGGPSQPGSAATRVAS